MSSYLEIALRVANRIQSVGSEPAAGISQPMGSIVEKSRSEITTQTVIKSGATAACGSSHCAGCYDVGDGRKIHPRRSEKTIESGWNAGSQEGQSSD